ncbi:hypothetical protein AMBR_DPAELIID_02783 [Lacticaseibacillus rhamnosus]|nr:hypothetical protein AMBR_DPAELIID_02783 [Lacticaseibacillus rhamnosus]
MFRGLVFRNLPLSLKSVKLGDYFALDRPALVRGLMPVSYTHLRAHETEADLVCRLLLEKKKTINNIPTYATAVSNQFVIRSVKWYNSVH